MSSQDPRAPQAAGRASPLHLLPGAPRSCCSRCVSPACHLRVQVGELVCAAQGSPGLCGDGREHGASPACKAGHLQCPRPTLSLWPCLGGAVACNGAREKQAQGHRDHVPTLPEDGVGTGGSWASWSLLRVGPGPPNPQEGVRTTPQAHTAWAPPLPTGHRSSHVSLSLSPGADRALGASRWHLCHSPERATPTAPPAAVPPRERPVDTGGPPGQWPQGPRSLSRTREPASRRPARPAGGTCGLRAAALGPVSARAHLEASEACSPHPPTPRRAQPSTPGSHLPSQWGSVQGGQASC